MRLVGVSGPRACRSITNQQTRSQSVTNLNDLASLRIDDRARAGSSRRWVWIAIAVIAAALAAGGWWWSQRVEAAVVRTATVTARNGAAAAPGAVLNASGYVTA